MTRSTISKINTTPSPSQRLNEPPIFDNKIIGVIAALSSVTIGTVCFSITFNCRKFSLTTVDIDAFYNITMQHVGLYVIVMSTWHSTLYQLPLSIIPRSFNELNCCRRKQWTTEICQRYLFGFCCIGNRKYRKTSIMWPPSMKRLTVMYERFDSDAMFQMVE